MGKRAGFEIGPLTWVKGEIDSSMQRGLEALRAAAANPEDTLQVSAAQAHLHQARGALAMVGLDGVTRIAEQLEGLLADLVADDSRRSAERFAAAERGFEGITSYLNLLVSGAPDVALALFGIYRDLLRARDRGEADPVDLYFPRLSPQPPHREKVPLLLHSEQVGPYLREQSARFQRGFLRYLRSDPAGVEEMRAAVEAIEVTQGKTTQRAFWWVALAFCDALATSALPADIDPRRFCKRIEEQIRRIAEGSQNVAERLMREALYFVARSRPQTDRLREVQELYQLAQTLPAMESPRSPAASEPASAAAGGQPLVNRVAAEIQANLGAIEQVLDAYFRDSRRRPELAALERPLQQVLGAFEMLGELRARDALAGCAQSIRRLEEPDYVARSEDFESIAQTLSGLGFYLEGLLLGEGDFDAAMRPIAAAKPRQNLSADQTAATVETELAEVRKGAQNLYEKWKRKPTDTLIKAELQRSLAAIRDDAGLVADAGLQSQAGAALEALQDEHATALAPEVARALEPIAPAAPAASPETARLIDASTESVDAELLAVYLEEAHDLLAAVEAAIRDWRAHADRQAPGQALQRLLHTLKGNARMVGAMSVGELAHGMETGIEQALSHGAPPAIFFDELENSCDRINRFQEQLQQSGARGAHPGADSALAAMPSAPAAESALGAPAAGEARLQSVLRVRAEAIDRLVAHAGEVSIARARIEAQVRSVNAAMRELTDNVTRLRGQLREIEIQAETQMQSRLKEVHDAQHAFDPLELDRFTRFQELTRLMAESVGDVQTVHQNLIQAVGEAENALAAQARLNSEFSRELMRLRMVPFSGIAERLHRVVRQAAKDCGKLANLDLRGAAVELDRTVLERMVGPIEHLLRNAVTHGIEAPEVRSRKGKPEIGDIRLEVAQEANEVRLALTDDGSGLDIAAIRARAASMGLLGEHATLSDAETADFIYLPGVTTAARLTQAAGRGIGMDVVKNEVAMLGGRIDLAFTRDKGTRFSIFLPLTLAAMNAVLVKARGQTYAIPSVMVEQVLQFEPERIAEATRSGQAEWQSRRLDFKTLSHLLGLAGAGAGQRRLAPVLLLRSGASAVALHVDEMAGGNHEIVVKATGPQLARIPGITGATVLGTGEIVLILNPVRLALRQAAAAPPAARAQQPVRAAPTVMVVDDSLTVRKITGRLLERQGYRVLAARDGVEATEMLQENLPDVMLVDIEMPRMDGFELTRKLRGEPRTAKIPIIMITSRAAEKHRNHAMEIGANVYLGKPFQEEMLLAHIAGFVGTK